MSKAQAYIKSYLKKTNARYAQQQYYNQSKRSETVLKK